VALRQRSAVGGSAIRILVADENAATRAGMRLALEREGLRICGEAGHGDEAVAAAAREHPDVCLLAADLPGGGISTVTAIRERAPETSVVVLAEGVRDADLFDVLRAGAVGYLGKDTNPDRLPSIVRGVLHGEVALSRHLVAKLVDEFRARGRRQRLELAGRAPVELTDREWEVVQLLRVGHDTGEIAARLYISSGTVRTHVAAILHKLGVADRDALRRLLAER
jgi:DNA-binding NarL/FixJ family response regulator